ncbi:hypothetical protein [Salipaludibacillus sp. CF4.18]|uniref:hypothetical protein n=1 Tax=Salipaludibacillus sp. CF4.18 TaxID=3373081 RepID=UPI003EE7F997
MGFGKFDDAMKKEGHRSFGISSKIVRWINTMAIAINKPDFLMIIIIRGRMYEYIILYKTQLE